MKNGGENFPREFVYKECLRRYRENDYTINKNKKGMKRKISCDIHNINTITWTITTREFCGKNTFRQAVCHRITKVSQSSLKLGSDLPRITSDQHYSRPMGSSVHISFVQYTFNS